MLNVPSGINDICYDRGRTTRVIKISGSSFTGNNPVSMTLETKTFWTFRGSFLAAMNCDWTERVPVHPIEFIHHTVAFPCSTFKMQTHALNQNYFHFKQSEHVLFFCVLGHTSNNIGTFLWFEMSDDTVMIQSWPSDEARMYYHQRIVHISKSATTESCCCTNCTFFCGDVCTQNNSSKMVVSQDLRMQ